MKQLFTNWKVVLGTVIVLGIIIWGGNNQVPVLTEIKTLLGNTLQLVVGGWVAIRILKKVF